MNLIVIFALVILWFSVAPEASAEDFQSYEAGTYPIRARIGIINKTIAAIEARLTATDLSSEEKESRANCLQQYLSEKKQLEEDLEAGRKISQLPGMMFLTGVAEQECTKGLKFSFDEQKVNN